jgi:hypothetical protein
VPPLEISALIATPPVCELAVLEAPRVDDPTAAVPEMAIGTGGGTSMFVDCDLDLVPLPCTVLSVVPEACDVRDPMPVPLGLFVSIVLFKLVEFGLLLKITGGPPAEFVVALEDTPLPDLAFAPLCVDA